MQKKKNIINAVIDSANATQATDSRDAQGDTKFATSTQGGGQGNKITFVLTLAVLVVSSLVGTLQ